MLEILEERRHDAVELLCRRLDGAPEEQIRGCGVLLQALATDSTEHALLVEVLESDSCPWPASLVLAKTLIDERCEIALECGTRWIEHRHVMLRSICAEALGTLDEPRVVPLLVRQLSDASECADMWATWRVMDQAACSLLRWRGRCPALSTWESERLREFVDGDPAALVSLAYVRHDAAIEPLVDAALRDDWTVSYLLRDYRSPRAVDALRTALWRADGGVRGSIARMLGRLGDPRCIPDLAELVAEPRAQGRAGAALGLSLLDHDEARLVLGEYVDDDDPAVRGHARDVLTARGDALRS